MSIEVTGLTKNYRAKTALGDVTLTFEPETIYGLLGSNGAGKSTLLNIVNNRVFPSTGTVTLDGARLTDNSTALRHTYLMSEDSMFPASMKVDAIMKFTEDVYGSIDWNLMRHLMTEFNVEPHARFSRLSTGYRTIVKLIVALAVPVDYVFLDEPILGLDATNRDIFYRALIQTYSDRPRTFVLSTHIIEEVASLLERVVIISDGHVLLNDSAENLSTAGHEISGPAALVDDFLAQSDVTVVDSATMGGHKALYTTGSLPALPEGLELRALGLQEFFIHVTKNLRRVS